MRGELSLWWLGYRIYSINHPRRLLKCLDLERGRLFEAGRLLNFHHFQQVWYVYFATKLYMLITKREDVTKQGFCKLLWRNSIY